jgi:hypothetical protein
MNDHDLLVRIDERVNQILERLEAGEKKFSIHEERIENLERDSNMIKGAIGLITLFFTSLGGYILSKIWR